MSQSYAVLPQQSDDEIQQLTQFFAKDAEGRKAIVGNIYSNGSYKRILEITKRQPELKDAREAFLDSVTEYKVTHDKWSGGMYSYASRVVHNWLGLASNLLHAF